MGQQLCMCGSVKRKALLDTWKSGQNSIWEIYINPVEVNQTLVKENMQRDLELAKEKSKTHQIEDKQKEVEAEILATRRKYKKKMIDCYSPTKDYLAQLLKTTH